MKYNIRGEKIKVTPAIREHITLKLSKLDKYFEFPDQIEANVLIKVKGREQKIEATILTPKFTLRNEEVHEDLYAAVDLLIDKLERQIRKNKTKLGDKKHRGVVKSFDFTVGETEEKNKIVKHKLVDLKPMDEEEAILQMNLLGHTFFIYKDMKSDATCIVYKRVDGDYGVIETK